jgi:hypothetical protein
MKNVNENYDAFGIHTIEMVKVITYEDYRIIRESTSMNAKTKNFRYYDLTAYTFLSEEFRSCGVTFTMVRPEKGPIIFHMRINPRRLIGDNTYIGIFEHSKENVDAAVENINRIFSGIGVDWGFESMSFSRIDVCANKVIRNPYESESYMRLIRKNRIPEGYVKEKFGIDEDNYQEKNKKSFRISNGVRTITVYDKRFQLGEENLMERDDSLQDIGLLRFEISIKPKSINRLKRKVSNKDTFEYCAKNSKRILSEQFSVIFDPMRYLSYDRALVVINQAYNEKIITPSLAKKMADLVRAVSASKNVNAALINEGYTKIVQHQKIINDKQLRKVMDAFKKIGLNPITLKEREPWLFLPPIIELLAEEITGEDQTSSPAQ